MHDAFGLKLTFCFKLSEGEYHTNVVLAVLASKAAIIAPDGFADADAAAAIASAYAAVTNAESSQNAFAGNAILPSTDAVWMSERA